MNNMLVSVRQFWTSLIILANIISPNLNFWPAPDHSPRSPNSPENAIFLPDISPTALAGPQSPDDGCAYPENVYGDVPLAWWRMGEASGITVVNSGGLGSVVDGTYLNSPTLGATGLVTGDTDTAASLDGIDDYVTIPIHNEINNYGPFSAKTIELWFNATNLTGRRVLYEQGGDVNGLNIYLDGNQLYAGAWTSSTGVWVNTTVSLNTTYHVVLVFNGAAGTISGYLNGTSFGSTSSGFSSILTHVGGIGTGGLNDNTRYHDGVRLALTGDNFAGTIDELALYNRALSSSRVLLHSQGCVSQVTPYQSKVGTDLPVAYWRLGEASGATAVDIGRLGVAVDGAYQSGTTLGTGSLIPNDTDTAASFDGTDDLVSIPNHTEVNTGGPYTAKTVELWFRANALSGRQVLYEQGGIHRGLNIYLDGNVLTAGAWNSDIGGWVTTAVSAGTNYYVVLTFNGSTQTVTGYLGGASFGSASTGFSSIDGHVGLIGIGVADDETRWSNTEATSAGSTEAYFNGVIDDVALYNKVLPEARIQIHAQGSSPTAVTLAGFNATPLFGEVQLAWETVLELDAIGFNLYRSLSVDGEQVRLNPEIIPSQVLGDIGGASYAYTDTDVQPGIVYYYWLEFIDTGGNTIYGPQQIMTLQGIFLPIIHFNQP